MIYCEEKTFCGKWVPVTYPGEALPTRSTGSTPPKRRNVKAVPVELRHMTLDQLREIYA